MAAWRIESHDAHTGAFVCDIPYANLQGELFVNKEDNFRFNVPTAAIGPTDFYPGVHEAWIFREDKQLFAGPFWTATITSDKKSIAAECLSLDSYLSEREVRSYIKTDYQDNHAWNYIQQCQVGPWMDLRIGRGSFTNKQIRTQVTIQPWQPKKVFDAINDLATTQGIDGQGFDWEIDSVTRLFNTWYPRRGIVRDIKLEYPGLIRSYSHQILARAMVNDLGMLGAGSGSKQWTARLDDVTSKQRFWGMQDTLTYSDAHDRATLNAKAQYNLNLLKAPKQVPSIELDMAKIGDSFDPFNAFGDIFPVKIDDGYVQIDTPMRNAGIQITVGGNGSETASFYLNDLRELATSNASISP